MRTTLDIVDDLLAATKELARRAGATAGQVVSRLLRDSLTGKTRAARPVRSRRAGVAGFEPFAAKPGVVTTNAQVDAIRDAEAAVRALLDAGQLHHGAATRWMAQHAKAGWASCPLTQNGCLRILSLPSYPNAQATAVVAERLGRATAGSAHAFWHDSISLLQDGLLRWDRVLSSRQITDAYLLALAAAHGGRFVTFDRGVFVEAVPSAAKKHLVTLA